MGTPTEEDIKEIKARMFIENTYENDYDNYDPYNLELMINNLYCFCLFSI